MTLKSDAWDRQVEQNEGWDGERGFRAAAKRRFEAEWKANGPAAVTVNTFVHGKVAATSKSFDHRKDAEKFAAEQAANFANWVTVHAVYRTADLLTGSAG